MKLAHHAISKRSSRTGELGELKLDGLEFRCHEYALGEGLAGRYEACIC